MTSPLRTKRVWPRPLASSVRSSGPPRGRPRAARTRRGLYQRWSAGPQLAGVHGGEEVGPVVPRDGYEGVGTVHALLEQEVTGDPPRREALNPFLS